MVKVFVAGARGRVGSSVARVLAERGVEVVAGDVEDGVDVVTGAGLDDALAGVDAIVNVLNTGRFDAEGAVAFFRGSTERLDAAGRAAGVRHHVLLSIVGVGDGTASSNGYYLGKVAQEAALRAGSVPSTVVRATQFHEYVPVLVDQHTQDGTVLATRALVQPVELGEVVELLAATVVTGPSGGVREIAGPDRFHLDDLFRASLAASGDVRQVVTVESPDPLDGLVPHGQHVVGTVRHPLHDVVPAA